MPLISQKAFMPLYFYARPEHGEEICQFKPNLILLCSLVPCCKWDYERERERDEYN